MHQHALDPREDMRRDARSVPPQLRPRRTLLTDIHAKLNPTRVAELVPVESLDDVIRAVKRARRQNKAISIAGGRHAMGGQQFGTGTIHIDTRGLSNVLAFDHGHGTITVEAGMQWPKLIRAYHLLQHGQAPQWGIAQKQTGADRLSIGGAIAANIHGRGLTMKPFVHDVVAFTLVNADGEIVRCSREENSELFRLVIGGYGLFGVVVSVTIKLVPRQKIERIVKTSTLDKLMSNFEDRITAGYLYGDFQFAIDPHCSDFLHKGVFSCYRPVGMDTPIPSNQIRLSRADWGELLRLAHVEKTEAFSRFADFYLASSGQIYWSDTHQLSLYLDDYHEALDKQLCAANTATEIITELYVPRDRLVPFMAAVRRDVRQHDADLVYGTVRLIERDDESFLAWAKDRYACVIFNLHTEHTPAGIAKSATQFRRLIDLAIHHGGSFFLTYHRFATHEQILAGYPQFPEFMRLKRRYDPDERFQSDWYRYHREMFSFDLGVSR